MNHEQLEEGKRKLERYRKTSVSHFIYNPLAKTSHPLITVIYLIKEIFLFIIILCAVISLICQERSTQRSAQKSKILGMFSSGGVGNMSSCNKFFFILFGGTFGADGDTSGAYLFVHVCVCMCMCMCMCVYTCIHVCVRVYLRSSTP